MVDSGGIWLNICKWNRKIYRKKRRATELDPHSFAFREIWANLCAKFCWGKIEQSMPILDWLVPAEEQQESAKQELIETQVLQEGHTDSLNMHISLSCFCFSNCTVKQYPRPGTCIGINKLVTHSNKRTLIYQSWGLRGMKIQEELLRIGFHSVARHLMHTLSN